MLHYIFLKLLILLTLISWVSIATNNCCDLLVLNDVKELKSCILSIASKHNSDILPTRAPYLVRKHGPKLLISFITRASQEIDEYAAYSLLSNILYMKKHNYGYLIEESIANNSRFKDDYTYHRKLAPILESLIDSNVSYPTVTNQCDYLIWIDADIIILDINFKIENIINRFPKANLIMSADVSSIANTGFIIIKNNRWSTNFLYNWYNERLKTNYINDQNGFEIVYNIFYNASRDKIIILPPDAINSDAPPMSRQKDHNQILHLASEHNDLRKEIFYKAACEMCKYENNVLKQLGIDRNYILNTTQRIYRNILNRKLVTIIGQNSLKFENSKDIIDDVNIYSSSKIPTIKLFAELRQVVSKYCYATSTILNGIETIETLQLRKFIYILTKFIISNIIAIINGDHNAALIHSLENILMDIDENEITSLEQSYCYDQYMKKIADINCQIYLIRFYFIKNFPEYLKYGCELALDYLLAIPSDNTNIMVDSGAHTDNIKEKINIGMYILSNIDKLLEIVDKSQHHLVLDMKASITSQLGEFSLLLNKHDEGIDYLQTSLQVYNNLGLSLDSDSNAISGGDLRNYFATVTLYATTQCSKGNYENGINLLEKVILLESNHVGNMHINIAAKYQQLGRCLLLNNNIELARMYFAKCNQIIAAENFESISCN